VKIENAGTETVQLRSRYWRITDARGRIDEVRGPGVVGEQPVLGPGDRFEYTSGTPLPTSSGFMVGTYRMVADSGEEFDVEIPAFSLDCPHEARRLT
jgi:ApaG protein